MSIFPLQKFFEIIFYFDTKENISEMVANGKIHYLQSNMCLLIILLVEEEGW